MSNAHWVERLRNRRVEYCAIRSSVCSHRSLIHLLRSSWVRGFCLRNERVDFISFQPTVQCFYVSITLRALSFILSLHERVSATIQCGQMHVAKFHFHHKYFLREKFSNVHDTISHKSCFFFARDYSIVKRAYQ